MRKREEGERKKENQCSVLKTYMLKDKRRDILDIFSQGIGVVLG